MFQKNCLYCGSSFTTSHSTSKFCSKVCSQRSQKGRKGITFYWLGKKRSSQTIKKMSENRKGIIAWNKGLTGFVGPMKGKKHTLETLKKISLKLKGRKVWNKGLSGPRGKNSPAWKGGFMPINKAIRLSRKYKEKWRLPIIKRDKGVCQFCGKVKEEIHVDHIKSLAIIIHENNIRTMKQAYVFSKVWDVGNGRVLCKDCHKQTDNFAGKVLKKLSQPRL